EATTCDPQDPATLSDQPKFVPPGGPNGANLRPNNANYLVVNKYSAAQKLDCTVNAGKVNLEQDIYAADGGCYAWEKDIYFKASCSETGGVVSICGDSACTACSSTTNYTSTCEPDPTGGVRRAICVGNAPGLAPFTPTSTNGSTPTTGGNGSATATGTAAAKPTSGAGSLVSGVWGVVGAGIAALALM
ncbi:hypothetical protein HK102_011461, partial [Quaeritorhiza haematococci]